MYVPPPSGLALSAAGDCRLHLLLPSLGVAPQVYTPTQATRAAKAAVGMLQVIEQRRPYADAAANLHAWPVTETDLNSG